RCRERDGKRHRDRAALATGEGSATARPLASPVRQPLSGHRREAPAPPWREAGPSLAGATLPGRGHPREVVGSPTIYWKRAAPAPGGGWHTPCFARRHACDIISVKARSLECRGGGEARGEEDPRHDAGAV